MSGHLLRPFEPGAGVPADLSDLHIEVLHRDAPQCDGDGLYRTLGHLTSREIGRLLAPYERRHALSPADVDALREAYILGFALARREMCLGGGA